MFQLVNDTPFQADRGVVMDVRGSHIYVVVVKATYQITGDEELRLASEQEKVCFVPEYSGEIGKSTCRRESELVFDHPGTTVSLLGHAWAPSGRPVKMLDLEAQMGQLRKTVRVFGDRHWVRSKDGLTPTEPEQFVSMPLVYERAFGGTIAGKDGAVAMPFEANPIGVGYAVREQDLAEAPLPNFEYAGDSTRHWSARPRPAGFAVIPSGWSPRKLFAGTFDDRWMEERMPLWPEDFDSRFFLASPDDLVSRVPFRGGERFFLRNFAQVGELSFVLPRVHLSFATDGGSWRRNHRAQLDRVYVEPDSLKVVLVWRTVLNCGADGRRVRKTFIDTKQVIR